MALAEVRESFHRLITLRLNAPEQQVDTLVDHGHLDLCRHARLQQSSEQFSQWRDERKQLGAQDMVFLHVHDAIGPGGVEADHGTLCDLEGPESRAAAALRRRKMRF